MLFTNNFTSLEFGPVDGLLGNTRKKPREEVTSTSGCETDRTETGGLWGLVSESDSGAIQKSAAIAAKEKDSRSRAAEKQQESQKPVPDRSVTKKRDQVASESRVEKTASLKEKLLQAKEKKVK